MTDSDEKTATELADELGQLDIKTKGDGGVLARVTDITGYDDTIQIDCKLVTGETFSQRFDKPAPWDMSYKFVRIAEDNGYDASSFDHLVGEEIQAKRKDDGWKIKDPGKITESDIDAFARGIAIFISVSGWVLAWGLLAWIQSISMFWSTLIAVIIIAIVADVNQQLIT